MFIKLSTDKAVRDVSKALESAITDNHFGLMQVHDLQATMMNKGINLENECLIFEVCQPQQAKKVLEQNMSVSAALPCRISIYTENNKTFLVTLKPSVLIGMFNLPQLKEVAEEVEQVIIKIMEDTVSRVQS